DEGIAEIHQPVHLHFEKEDYNPMDSIILSKEEIKVDLHKIEFPLILRRWKPGDSMIPFGMKGRKKLSDLFTDLKMSRPDKEKQWLLCSGQDVVWVVGVKADDRFRISQSTQTLLHIRLLTETNNKR
ncbi:MAG: tRNA lysidine(34) synthetase TilS, partial [Marinilabiliales bacterium]|nr:tRNA lysidine(34) synthetase TilS [Marinilabiliales bacterium]